MLTVKLLLLATLVAADPSPAGAGGERGDNAHLLQRPADRSRLSLDRLFAGNEFAEEHLGMFQWSKRTPDYFLLEAADDGKRPSLVRVEAETGKKVVVVPPRALIPPGRTEPLEIDGLELSADESKVLIYTNHRRVWRQKTRGDYWLLDLATGRLVKLGGDAAPSTLMFAKFSPDGTRVAYVRENNLHVQRLDDMRITSLTSDGSDTVFNGRGDWVNEEELDIRDGFRWSPDGKSILFWQFDASGVPQFHLLQNAENNYPRVVSFPYPKVGETNSAVRLGVVGVAGGPVRWLKVPGDPREHYIARAEWTLDGGQVAIQQFNRVQNVNRVMLAEPANGATRLVLTETDSAWVENENPFRWVNRGRGFVWLSERDGRRHAYLAGLDGKRLSRITRGDFDAIDVEAVDEAGGWVYYAASPENPTQRYLYRTRLDGGAPERLSPAGQPGWHTYHFSPDAKWAVHSYSTFMTPPVMELVRMPGHEVVRILVDNRELRRNLSALNKPAAEFLRVDVGNGVELDAWCLKPPGFDPAGKYPLLFFVYGEPAGQTVRDGWCGHRHLWHWMLAQQGYLVASVDNRGTHVPRGRSWRKCVYRQIGILASHDQAAAARAMLRRWPFADPRRVGIWGWSGGGSMSLNMIFRYPELYQAAIAVAPNASQLLYDTIYQERYMGLLKDNPQGYRDGSPITHAHRLQGDLLVVHGTGDDNGHYLGTQLLIDELVAHNKHFSVMPYPDRSHAISEGANTTRHLHGLFTRYLHEHLPPGGGQTPGVRATNASAESDRASAR